jgi:hypothetical protein
MPRKKSQSKSKNATASSSTTTSTPPAQPWEELRTTLLLDFVRELSSLTNVFSMSNLQLPPSELTEVHAMSTLKDKLLTPFDYKAFDQFLQPLADKLSMPLCVFHLLLLKLASCAKKAWSHDQGKNNSFIVTHPLSKPTNQDVVHEEHDDNTQKQKPTTQSSSSQVPITAKDDNAIIINQHVNDQQPRDDNPWTLQTRKKVK